MLPGTSNEDLVYVGAENIIEVFSYPGLQSVGELSGFSNPLLGLCTDRGGDVFAVEAGNPFKHSKIVEYRHGATTPFLTLDDGAHFPNACAVDPTTGNLAVVGGANHLEQSNIAIYPHARGRHRMYYPPATALRWCTYDNQGNLFANFEGYGSRYDNGIELLKVSHVSGAFTIIEVTKKGYVGGDVEWDGEYLAVRNPYYGFKDKPMKLYRVAVTGSSAKIVKIMTFKEPHRGYHISQFAILNGKIITPTWQARVGLWNYPQGGPQTGWFKLNPANNPLGLVVSVPGNN